MYMTSITELVRIRKYLADSYDNGTLLQPDLPNMKSYGIDASSAEPKYTPVQFHIDQNYVPPIEGQEGRFKVGPLDNLDTPEICFGPITLS